MTTATTMEATTPSVDERIAARLAELSAQLDALQDPASVPLSWTPQQLADMKRQRAEIEARQRAIHTAAENRAALGSDEADQQWIAHLAVWRKTLCDELVALPPRIRDKAEIARQRDLTFSIKLIDFGYTLGPAVTLAPTRIGELMAAAGYETSAPGLHGPRGWRGSLKDTEQRIKDLSKQRTAAEGALAEALIDDDARATREARHDEYRKALKTMHIRNGADGRSLVAFTLDDDVLDVSEMTPLQREAFEWFSEAASPKPAEARRV